MAHLRRHFQRLIKTPGLHNKAIGEAFKDLIDEAFRHYRTWQQDQDSHLYYQWVVEFEEQVKLTLKQWWAQAGHEAGKLLRNLQQKADQWWYFLHHPEIPTDHNLAERSLRLAITKRKVSGGSRSMERFQQTANLLTVVQTCRRQGRSVIDFFEQSLIARAGHDDCLVPSLIPNS